MKTDEKDPHKRILALEAKIARQRSELKSKELQIRDISSVMFHTLSGAKNKDMKLASTTDESDMWHGIAAKTQLELTMIRLNWWVRIGYKLGIVRDVYAKDITK